MVTFNFYNFSSVANATNASNALTDLARVTSEQTGFAPGVYILVVVFSVFFISLMGKGYGAKNCFAACSWVTMILAIIMYPLHIIDGVPMIIFVMLMPISMFLLYIGD